MRRLHLFYGVSELKKTLFNPQKIATRIIHLTQKLNDIDFHQIREMDLNCLKSLEAIHC